MSKTKQKSQIIQSLEELISDYDRPTLITALQVLENDLGWKVFRAALMKEYLHSMSYLLDDASKTGKQIEAAYRAGAAQTMFDTANSLIDKYKTVLENNTRVLENVRPEE